MIPDSDSLYDHLMTLDSDFLFKNLPNESGVKSHDSWIVHSLPPSPPAPTWPWPAACAPPPGSGRPRLPAWPESSSWLPRRPSLRWFPTHILKLAKKRGFLNIQRGPTGFYTGNEGILNAVWEMWYLTYQKYISNSILNTSIFRSKIQLDHPIPSGSERFNKGNWIMGCMGHTSLHGPLFNFLC